VRDLSDEKIREEAKKALRERGLKCVIGWSADGTPFFAETEEDIDKLSFNKSCANNLVPYLTQEIRSQRGKTRDGKDKVVKPVGIVVRGCDSKALLLLLNENILSRKEIFIIGVPCTGVVDRHAGNALYKKCMKCAMRNPVVYDVLASEKVQEDAKDYSEIEAIENMTPEERWKFWEEVFADCIRCHACKRSCPVCYCDECMLDPTEIAIRPDTTAEEKAHRPRWVERSVNVPENLVYHLARLPHLAGRCVDCGECERVCPQRLPLRLLTAKLEKDVKKIFNYEAASEEGQKPLIAVSCAEDENGFIM
jgi:formate dehydrogenase subunit beta